MLEAIKRLKEETRDSFKDDGSGLSIVDSFNLIDRAIRLASEHHLRKVEEAKPKTFYCFPCNKWFESDNGFPNPVFWADMVALHDCGAKCWGWSSEGSYSNGRNTAISASRQAHEELTGKKIKTE